MITILFYTYTKRFNKKIYKLKKKQKKFLSSVQFSMVVVLIFSNKMYATNNVA